MQLLLLLPWIGYVHGLSTITSNKVVKKVSTQQSQLSQRKSITPTTPNTYSFTIPLTNKRPKPTSFLETLSELWNDPRPISDLIASNDRSNVGERKDELTGDIEEIPYCIVSDEFEVEDGELFQILLYPRGRFVREGAGRSGTASSNSNDDITGPASAYLRYLPNKYGDEIDIAWKLQLSYSSTNANGDDDGNDNYDDNGEENQRTLSISTSGGLPKSNTTWSAAMTFCTEYESVESVGRTTDWGSSTWSAREVCNALGSKNLVAEGEITVFDRRSGESSFGLALPMKGAMGAVLKARNSAAAAARSTNTNTNNVGNVLQRDYRVGEVIVPRDIPGLNTEVQALKETFVYPGIDYRIMTMADQYGNPIFSTESLKDGNEKSQARLALRPCGWKTQQQLWKQNGMTTDWPIDIPVHMVSQLTTTRFNPDSAIPRIVSAFQRDWFTYTLALCIAITPIPLTLFARNFVSLYDIPSASMEPTLLKGDVLLVEKFPGVYDRTGRGDVVLFRPPSALRDIVYSSGSQLSSTSLFLKRIAGLPGDDSIRLVDDNGVSTNGMNVVGPDRNLYADEPLQLIEKYLENGNGKDFDKLGDDDVYVLGDCKAVSVDSRVFGILPKENIVGKPMARIWPLDRIKLSGPF
mmetsp:Transcript_18279/g.38221  ORF Transcript_18279/g.38221 Transcript_18279/m.38221 type:complete len:637 (-) Transcript_18279:1405-3315(-)